MKKQLIYDIGMHIGKDTDFYLKKGFNVVAVEANPILIEKAKIKFKKEIEENRLIIVDKAINSSKSPVDLYISDDNDDWGTIIPSWNSSMNVRYKTVQVDSILLEDILFQHGTPYYMKIDIEGADLICLKSLLNIVDRPAYISVELLTPNNLKTQTVDALDILCFLKALGYNKFKISNQSKNKQIRCPNPALEGKYIDHTFGGDSSGLFGKELQGEWYSIDEVAQNYLYYFYKQGNTGNRFFNKFLSKLSSIMKPIAMFPPNGWFDVHASQ